MIPAISPHSMDNEDVKKKVEEFLKNLGVPGFIVFGYQREKDNFEIISSFNKMPIKAAIKGLSQVLNDFVKKTL